MINKINGVYFVYISQLYPVSKKKVLYLLTHTLTGFFLIFENIFPIVLVKHG